MLQIATSDANSLLVSRALLGQVILELDLSDFESIYIQFGKLCMHTQHISLLSPPI